MNELIAFALGVGVSWSSIGLGALLYRQRIQNARPKPPPPIEARCGCKHHYAEHDETGCHHINMKVTKSGTPVIGRNDFYEKDVVLGYEGEESTPVRCGCKRYTGPEPLPTYYAPEIGS